METLMHPNQHNIFFVPIWGYVIKGEQYHSSDYLDLIAELEAREPSVRKSNFGGWQSRDNLHKEPIFQELRKSLSMLANDIAKSQMLPPVHLISMWANVNYKNSFNAPHTHEGIFSGVFYLTAPENSGKLIFKNPVVRSETSAYKLPNYPIYPGPLACIIFPSWLEHYVEPSLSDERRVSLSFNFDIERPIS